MRERALATMGAAVLAAGSALAADTVVPTFAWHVPGASHSLWTSEVYLSNPGPLTARVDLSRVITGRIRAQFRCLPPINPVVEVPPYSSVLVPATQVALALGCPLEFLGALVMGCEQEITVSSRLVNERKRSSATGERLLEGVGEEVPGLPRASLPHPGATFMLPAMAWHPNACGAPFFDSYLQLVNAGDGPVALTLNRYRDGRPGELVVDGVEVATPYTVRLGPASWRQIKVEPPPSMLAVCLPAELFDLFFEVDGELAIYASVVDRTTQDARTVLPVASADAAVAGAAAR